MLEKEEIILMTKLALYEKRYGKQDSKRNSYFKWDYIYKNNWFTRFAVFISAMIVISWLMFRDVYIDEIIPIIDVDISLYFSEYGLIVIIAIAIYTGISTLVYNKKYKETQDRLEEYQSMLDKLEEYQSQRELARGNISDAD